MSHHNTDIESDAAPFIEPLNISGLNGRVLRAPATRKNANREMLLLYGHHALLERWWGLVQTLQDFGPVTMPDLPGFGGMDSFAKIHRAPTIDTYADYLAAFIKLTYKRKRITIIGISFGFVVTMRMLQKYPELAKKVDLVVSMMGFTHSTDFRWTLKKRQKMRLGTRLFGTRPMAFFIRYCVLNKFIIDNVYIRSLPGGQRKFMKTPPEDYEKIMDFEVKLWQVNDVRTHWITTTEFLHLQNSWQPVNVPLYHVKSSGDQYFDNYAVEQHLKVIFSDVTVGTMNSHAHTPSIIADKEAMSVMVPASLRKILKRKA